MRTILYIILFLLLYRIAKAVLFPQKAYQQRQEGSMVHGGEMVLDPVCRSYFPKAEALSARKGDETVYFCSEECRGKFLKTVS